MPHVHAEHGAVLEFVENSLVFLQQKLSIGGRISGPFLLGLIRENDRVKLRHQFVFQLLPSVPFRERFDIAHHREKIVVLQSQEVVPKKIAHSEESCEGSQHIVTVQRSEFTEPVVLFKKLLKQFAKMQEGILWIRRLW